jgi:hypothetical protein
MRTLEDWARVATIAAGVAAVAALWFTAFQLQHAARASQSQFWLELRKMMGEHNNVHMMIRPGGEWRNPGEGPSSVEEWASVDSYMGLFEHCELMLRKRLIDAETFTAIYRYRLTNILANDKIVYAKLIKGEKGWQHFIGLLNRVDLSGELDLARERARRAVTETGKLSLGPEAL